MSRIYELPLARNYVSHWGLQEAVRELLQNAIDSEDPLEYSVMDHTLSITSRYTTLPASTLVLGQTTKAGVDAQIGNFGEGFKLALLVLAREGYPVKVMNGDKLWTPSFVHSETFGTEVLQIAEEELGGNQGLTFQIDNLQHDDTTAIYDLCLFMQPAMTDVIGTPFGSILPSRPGFLYVGGLLVCETSLKYGYDILPKHLKLERDRQTVADWDIHWVTKDMWLSTQNWEHVAKLMEDDLEDVRLIEYDCPELLKEACYRQFKKNNPGALAVKSQTELEQVVAKKMVKTVFINSGSYYAAISGAKEYKEVRSTHMARKTPVEELQEWLAAHQRDMRFPVRVAFQQLLVKAKEWKS